MQLGYREELRKYVETEKQKTFFEENEWDFLRSADEYEAWDEIDFNRETVTDISFKVTLEDIKNYAKGALDTNPLFNNEEYAKNSFFGEIIAPPMISTAVEFWCLRKGMGNWIRTPGSRNPGMSWEFYGHIRVGDEIRLRVKPFDRWIKRKKYYLTYQMDFIDQNDAVKMRHWVTLILPKTRADLIRFMEGEHALEA
jgi:acyl dehydratase